MVGQQNGVANGDAKDQVGRELLRYARLQLACSLPAALQIPVALRLGSIRP